jgi:hypothetical protein
MRRGVQACRMPKLRSSDNVFPQIWGDHRFECGKALSAEICGCPESVGPYPLKPFGCGAVARCSLCSCIWRAKHSRGLETAHCLMSPVGKAQAPAASPFLTGRPPPVPSLSGRGRRWSRSPNDSLSQLGAFPPKIKISQKNGLFLDKTEFACIMLTPSGKEAFFPGGAPAVFRRGRGSLFFDKLTCSSQDEDGATVWTLHMPVSSVRTGRDLLDQ